MRETPQDIARFQRLLDESYAARGEHIASIITDERLLTAEQLVERLTGMRLLNLATTTSDGRPRVSPVDGIFFKGEFWFGSAPNAFKIRHIQQRPDVSATYLEGEPLALTIHGKAHVEGSPVDLAGTEFAEVATEIYGEGWDEWAEAVYARIEAEQVFVFYMEHPPEG